MPDIISLWVVANDTDDVHECGALWGQLEIRGSTFLDACGELEDLIYAGYVIPKPTIDDSDQIEAACEAYAATRRAAHDQGWPDVPWPDATATPAEIAEWERLRRPRVEGIGFFSAAEAEAIYRALCGLGPEAMASVASNEWREIAYWNMRAVSEEAVRRGACMYVELK